MLTPLFLNLSNHPLALWEAPQLAAARALGEPEDLPFPVISPEADDAEIAKLAEEYAQQIMPRAEEREVVVHLMGELTFCFALVARLQRAGIRCVASCSQRDAQLLEDGSKRSVFRFVQFRNYPSSL